MMQLLHVKDLLLNNITTLHLICTYSFGILIWCFVTLHAVFQVVQRFKKYLEINAEIKNAD